MMMMNLDCGRMMRFGGAWVLGVALLAGCASKQDQAIDQAKKQAAATGQAQQVVSIDKAGNTTTTTVQPPAAGQTAQAVTTVVTPAAGAPASGQAAAPAQAPVMAVAGGPPVIRPADVNIPAGSSLAIRINQRISVKTTPAGTGFDGEVVESWQDANGRVILPKGTPVSGMVVASHRRGHFKGASILELRLTSLTLNGTQYPVETRDLTRTKKGKGKRTAAFIGGGTGLGMLIGGVASGGTGLLIGGLAGGGAGTAISGLTGNRDLDIPAESIVRFKLSDDLVLQG
jgi:outer membrane murein-binding lipoprotein Lpp